MPTIISQMFVALWCVVLCILCMFLDKTKLAEYQCKLVYASLITFLISMVYINNHSSFLQISPSVLTCIMFGIFATAYDMYNMVPRLFRFAGFIKYNKKPYYYVFSNKTAIASFALLTVSSICHCIVPISLSAILFLVYPDNCKVGLQLLPLLAYPLAFLINFPKCVLKRDIDNICDIQLRIAMGVIMAICMIQLFSNIIN